ncbi:MAG: FAD-dependent oxidoreductase [Sphingobacteriales bacterium]|nr:MAG: FAD-dependent oxidoreductase [Sphingobacteriales bacterium]
MQTETEILIIGGGLAGLTAALHLQKTGFHVTLIEKNFYPHHKVCGEYVSNEVLPYLNWLGISFKALNPSSINRLQFTSSSGTCLNADLPLGGFGLSRYAMDNFLYLELIKRGVTVLFDTVTDVIFDSKLFLAETASGQQFVSKQVLGAFGKRSLLDKSLKRDFILRKSPYLAVKAHYEGAFPAAWHAGRALPPRPVRVTSWRQGTGRLECWRVARSALAWMRRWRMPTVRCCAGSEPSGRWDSPRWPSSWWWAVAHCWRTWATRACTGCAPGTWSSSPRTTATAATSSTGAWAARAPAPTPRQMCWRPTSSPETSTSSRGRASQSSRTPMSRRGRRCSGVPLP